MFEDSVFSSGAQRGGARTRWAAVAAFGTQVALLGVAVAVPLLRPEALTIASNAPAIVDLAKPPVPKVEVKPRVIHVANSPATLPPPEAPAPEVLVARGAGLRRIVPGPGSDAPVLGSGGPIMGSGGFGLGVLGNGAGTSVRVVPRSSGPSGGGGAGKLKISSGVSTGLLLHPIEPVYPRIAVAAHLQGTVVLSATISKDGRIVGLQVVSGPAMLRSAAVDAVREARYRPFLLNGEATEVETTISVNFRMGG